MEMQSPIQLKQLVEQLYAKYLHNGVRSPSDFAVHVKLLWSLESSQGLRNSLTNVLSEMLFSWNNRIWKEGSGISRLSQDHTEAFRLMYVIMC